MALFHRCRIVLPILLASSVMLSGCTKVGPDYVRPKTALLTNWLEIEDERVKNEPVHYRAWWEVFNDPVLNRIIDLAYRGNLPLRMAGVRVLQARAQVGIAVGNLYPQTQQVEGSLTYNRASEQGVQGASSQAAAAAAGGGGGGGGFDYWQDQIGLRIAWEIDFWGRFRRAVESADANLMATIADYDSVLVSLTADAASYYVQIRTLQKRLAIARDNVNLQQESFQIAESRFLGGIATERDVEQARALLYNTMATISVLETQLRQAQYALSLLLGLPPDTLANILDADGGIPAPPPQVALGIPADLLRRRPDIRRAELQAVAQSAQIGVAKADLLPAFAITGSFGFQSSTLGSSNLLDIVSWGSRFGSVGPAFQWDILNYGRITNNVRLQDAQFQELLIAYQNAVLTAQREVEDSLVGYLKAQENAELLAQSTAAAMRSLEIAMVQYQQGITDFTTVISAQQALLTAQDSFASALGNISGYLVGVYRALGGGWQIREGDDFVPPEIKEVMARRTNWGDLLSPQVVVQPVTGPECTIRKPDW